MGEFCVGGWVISLLAQFLVSERWAGGCCRRLQFMVSLLHANVLLPLPEDEEPPAEDRRPESAAGWSLYVVLGPRLPHRDWGMGGRPQRYSGERLSACWESIWVNVEFAKPIWGKVGLANPFGVGPEPGFPLFFVVHKYLGSPDAVFKGGGCVPSRGGSP